MIKLEGYMSPRSKTWRIRGMTGGFCRTVISRIFGALDPKATYEIRFYSKKPRTEVVELQIRKTTTLWPIYSAPETKVSIRKGKGVWHTIESATFAPIWGIAKPVQNGNVRKVYVRLIETARRT